MLTEHLCPGTVVGGGWAHPAAGGAGRNYQEQAVHSYNPKHCQAGLTLEA